MGVAEVEWDQEEGEFRNYDKQMNDDACGFYPHSD